MITAHKIELKPTNKQIEYLAKACGTARFAYNWGLANWNKSYEDGESVSEGLLRKQLNSIKKSEFPWMYEVTKCSPQLAVMNLGTAFKNFFNKQSKYPVFKKKGIHDSFEVDNISIKFQGAKKILLPNLLTPIKMTEELRFKGKILNATYSRVANKWFVSINVEVPDLPSSENQASVGIDLGITSTVVTSNNEIFNSPKPLKKRLKKIKYLQKSVSRKVKGSNNRKKARMKLAIAHYKVTCVRSDFTHKMTTKLVSSYGLICMEDLNVNGMIKNHKLAQSLSDVSFGEIRRQLDYKMSRKGQKLVFVDRFYPSTKTCSSCGNVVDDMPLGKRTYNCKVCGYSEARDLNASKNILKQIPKVMGDFKPVETVGTSNLYEAGINY